MNFEVSSFKVNELAKVFDIKPPVISKKFKEMNDGVEKRNNRIIGISPSEIEKYFSAKGHDHLFKTTIWVVNSTVGGTSKTSSCLGFGGSLRRLTSTDKPLILVDCDSQSSLSTTLLGEPTSDQKPVLVDFFENKATLDDILTKVNDQEIYCIGSNLNNIYLDKALATPKAIKESMKKLFDSIIDKFGEGCRIVVDTPPQLSSSTSSAVCGLAQFIEEGKDYNLGLVIPCRGDSFALKGAKLSFAESKDVCQTFSLPEIPVSVFISGFDKRLKVGIEIMRTLLTDEALSEYVSPIMVRHSSEIARANLENGSIFYGKQTNATADYLDLTLYLLGFEAPGGTA